MHKYVPSTARYVTEHSSKRRTCSIRHCRFLISSFLFTNFAENKLQKYYFPSRNLGASHDRQQSISHQINPIKVTNKCDGHSLAHNSQWITALLILPLTGRFNWLRDSSRMQQNRRHEFNESTYEARLLGTKWPHFCCKCMHESLVSFNTYFHITRNN